MTAYIPSKITAGVTLNIRVALPAYPAPDWSLDLIVRGPSEIDLTSTADGADHLIEATAAESATWSDGEHWYSLRATDGVDVIEVDAGAVEIVPDLAAKPAGYDGRGHIEKVLTAIEAVIEGRASQDQERYRINNRELQRTPIADLMKLRDTYKAELRRKRRAQAGSSSLLGRRLLTRF